MPIQKTIVGKDGTISFDGLPFLEMPVSDLLALPSQEASGKGIVVINQRRTVRLSDVTSQFNGQPVEFVVSVRVERSPIQQTEQDLMDRTSETKQANKDRKDAKETATRREHTAEIARVAKETAIDTLRLSTGNKTIADSIRESLAVVDALRGITGRPALGTGE
jgi:hypothetical protein